MRRAALIFIAFSLIALLPAIAQDRGLAVVAREVTGQSDFDVGRQLAVIIGIDRYKEWTPLRGAVSEAKKVKAVLAERYYIDEFVELYDEAANATGIRRLFTQDLPKKLGIHDSLLVFYAGHGYLDTSKTGFWIASDGVRDELSQAGWIPNAQLRNYIGQLKAQRVLVMADACFSGDFLNVYRGSSPVVDSAYYRKALQLTARQVLTSGASESVPDDSEFGAQLVNLLERNTEKLLDPFAMFDRIKLGMTKTLPLMGSLPGNETGASFVLFLKPQSPEPSSSTPTKLPSFVLTPIYGQLVVTTEMPGTLYLDGRLMGELPVGKKANLGDIEVGDRLVEIRYSSGEPEKEPVTIREGIESTVAFTGKPKPPTPTPATTTTPITTPAVAQLPSTPQPPAILGDLVYVKGGSFMMGSNEGDSDEKPVHEVRVSDFYIGKYEVTQALYRSVTGSSPSYFEGDTLPVEQVSWYEAVAFCNKLSEREGLKKAYTISGTSVSVDFGANGYRLPTEAEWEYAARGGTAGVAQAVKYSGSDSVDDVAWYSSNSGSTTHAVGTKAPNALGLYDMSGNVWEWCGDWYARYSTAFQADPVGASSGGSRVFRGGSWYFAASYMRSAFRYRHGDPEYRYNSVGFRLSRRP